MNIAENTSFLRESLAPYSVQGWNLKGLDHNLRARLKFQLILLTNLEQDKLSRWNSEKKGPCNGSIVTFAKIILGNSTKKGQQNGSIVTRWSHYRLLESRIWRGSLTYGGSVLQNWPSLFGLQKSVVWFSTSNFELFHQLCWNSGVRSTEIIRRRPLIFQKYQCSTYPWNDLNVSQNCL